MGNNPYGISLAIQKGAVHNTHGFGLRSALEKDVFVSFLDGGSDAISLQSIIQQQDK